MDIWEERHKKLELHLKRTCILQSFLVLKHMNIVGARVLKNLNPNLEKWLRFGHSFLFSYINFRYLSQFFNLLSFYRVHLFWKKGSCVETLCVWFVLVCRITKAFTENCLFCCILGFCKNWEKKSLFGKCDWKWIKEMTSGMVLMCVLWAWVVVMNFLLNVFFFPFFLLKSKVVF